MNSIYRSLLTALLFLPLSFFSSPSAAQDEVQLLYGGLLGYAGPREDESLLLASAAIGQVYAGPARGAPLGGNQLDSSLTLRLGSFRFKEYILDEGYDSIPFFGVGGTRGINDFLSTRFSLDLGFGSSWDEVDLMFMPIKASLILGPSLTSGTQGYFKPYVGLGIEFDYFYETSYDFEDFSEWGFGFHFLAGAEYVINSFSLGLEFNWSSVEISGSDANFGGVSFMLNLGFHF